ncbi:hypothetical protein SCB49_13200 [unidentified eubacterium SCB49]|nr:hypothetical protein SCB49_13200 [unidentified eubacterium SCB49]
MTTTAIQHFTKYILLNVICCFSFFTASCQNNVSDQPLPYSYVIDDTNNIIVWNTSEILNTGNWSSFNFDGSYQLETSISEISKNQTYQVTKDNKAYTVYPTRFPVIHISAKDSIIDAPKIAAEFRYYDKDTSFVSTIGIEHRGNISLKFPKKSFDIEFWDDEISKESKDLSFNGLREDDDFVLDAMYNEPLRMRANFSQQLWRAIHTPYYIDEEPEAKSGIGEQYVEVFVNNEYQGIFLMVDQVDRKLLKLKKKEEGIVRGELYKAAYYQGATEFKEAPEFKSSLPHWGGFRLEYPDVEDYVYFFDNIQKTTAFVVNASEEEFAANYTTHFNEQNLIDYYLFINLLRGTDNLGKNYYIAKYNTNTPYFIVPWDLDGVLGTVIDGREMNITTDILSNHLFSRLWDENPNEYRKKVIARWQELRQSHFKDEALFGTITNHITKFNEQHVFEREALLWKQGHDDKDLLFMTTWLKKRLAFLDAHFIDE